MQRVVDGADAVVPAEVPGRAGVAELAGMALDLHEEEPRGDRDQKIALVDPTRLRGERKGRPGTVGLSLGHQPLLHRLGRSWFGHGPSG